MNLVRNADFDVFWPLRVLQVLKHTKIPRSPPVLLVEDHKKVRVSYELWIFSELAIG